LSWLETGRAFGVSWDYVCNAVTWVVEYVSTIGTDRGALTKSCRHDRSTASPRALVATTAMANSLSGVSPG
jgi:hypothetical protein